MTMWLAILLALSVAIPSLHATTGKRFTKYDDKAPTAEFPGNPVAVVSVTSRGLGCHSACVRRDDCRAFWVSGGTCSLYDTWSHKIGLQLQTQAGDAFFNIAPEVRLSVLTGVTSQMNGGWANFFPQLTVKRAGLVRRWDVWCQEAGTVYLSIWRGDVTSTITLVGKNRIDISSKFFRNGRKVYTVPFAEAIAVEAGDFVGIHSISGPTTPHVRVTDDAVTPEGIPVAQAYSEQLYDSDLPVGVQLDGTLLGIFDHRVPSLVLYIV